MVLITEVEEKDGCGDLGSMETVFQPHIKHVQKSEFFFFKVAKILSQKLREEWHPLTAP